MVFGMKSVVKNIFSVFEPTFCRGCGEVGDYLCGRCKKYIIEHVRERQTEYGKVFKKMSALGYRDEILGELIEEYKYNAVRGLGRTLGEILAEAYFAKSAQQGATLLVPTPASRKHLRERGFDHIDLIAREIERKSRGKVRRARLLLRAEDSVQVGASGEARRAQAKKAFRLNPKFLDADGHLKPEILSAQKIIAFDDVWTTGSTLTEAGKKLQSAGAQYGQLYALAIVKSRRGKKPHWNGGVV